MDIKFGLIYVINGNKFSMVSISMGTDVVFLRRYNYNLNVAIYTMIHRMIMRRFLYLYTTLLRFYIIHSLCKIIIVIISIIHFYYLHYITSNNPLGCGC